MVRNSKGSSNNRNLARSCSSGGGGGNDGGCAFWVSWSAALDRSRRLNCTAVVDYWERLSCNFAAVEYLYQQPPQRALNIRIRQVARSETPVKL